MPRGTGSIDCTVAEAMLTPVWLPSMFMALLAVEVRASALPVPAVPLLPVLVSLMVLLVPVPVPVPVDVLPVLPVPAVLL